MEAKQAKNDLKLMVVLFKTYQTLSSFIKEDIKETSFNLNEFAVLEVVYHKKEITVNEIHEKVLVANSSLSYILEKLEKKDLIERRQCQEDKRVTYISLSVRGQEISNEIFPRHYNKLREIFNNISAEEANKTIDVLKRISQGVNK